MLAVGLAVVAGVRASGSDEDRAQVVDGPATSPGWVRLEYRDVQVVIPEDWARGTGGDCLQTMERWGPPTSATCGARSGVSFPDSETFDPAGEPNVVTPGLDADGPSWSGYARLGDVVVSVSDDDRAVVQRVLRSVSMQGFQPID